MFGGNSSHRKSTKLGKDTLPEEDVSVAGVKGQCRNHSGGSPHVLRGSTAGLRREENGESRKFCLQRHAEFASSRGGIMENPVVVKKPSPVL